MGLPRRPSYIKPSLPSPSPSRIFPQGLKSPVQGTAKVSKWVVVAVVVVVAAAAVVVVVIAVVVVVVVP